MSDQNKRNLALEEYKLVFDSYYRSEDVYTKWENMFILSEGILVAGIAQLIVQSSLLALVVSVVVDFAGLFLSLVWYLIQSRMYLFSRTRLNRLKELERLLKTEIITAEGEKKEVFVAMSYMGGKTDPKSNKLKWSGSISSWKLRITIPIIFMVLWVTIIALVLMSKLT